MQQAHPEATSADEMWAEETRSQSSLVPLMIVVLIAAILRCLFIGHKSLWLDEAVSVSIARLDWHAFRETLWLREGNMALYYLLLRPVMVWGESEWQARLLSAICGIATVPLVFGLGTRLFGRRTGLLAAFLFAVNACSVVYSQEARGYSLAVLLVTVSTLLFVKLVQSPSWLICGGYALLSALAIYAHFFSVLVIVAQWLSLVALPRTSFHVKKMSFAVALTALLATPAALFVANKNTGQLSWVPKPSLLEFYHLAVFLSAEGGKVIGNILLAFFLVMLVVAGREALRAWHSSGRSLESWGYMLAFSCLLWPIALTLIISLHTPVFFHRFLIVCLPAFILLAAAGLSRTKRFVWTPALLIGLSIAASALSYTRTREQWREAASFVVSQARPGDAIVFFEPWGRIPFNYYVEQSHAPPNLLMEIQPEALAGHTGEIWAVIYPMPQIDPATREAEDQLDTRFPRHIVHDFRGLRIIRYEASGR